MIEIINELSLTGLVSMLVYINQPNRWNKNIEDVFILTIISTSSCVLLILLISFIGSFISKCCKRNKAKIEVKRIETTMTQLDMLNQRNNIFKIDSRTPQNKLNK